MNDFTTYRLRANDDYEPDDEYEPVAPGLL